MTERLDSLDLFRGVTVAGMILVSTPGTWNAVYPALEHAAWNGWTPTDLVFPFFLFAMGAAVPFALARRRGTSRRIRTHVMRRALILFGLGLLLNAIETPPPLTLSTFRIPGVLQRIGIVYAAVSWLTERASTRTQVGATIAALLGYWVAMTLIPVPGVGAPALTAEANIGSYIDRHVFGRHMLYPLWDPEGLLSSVPSIATAMCGVFAGEWLHQRGETHRALKLFGAGAAGAIAGVLWGRLFPLNKNLWTSSFAIFTAGLAAQTLAACYWLVDVRKWRRWAGPFIAFGRNALIAYFLSVGLDAVLSRWAVAANVSLKEFAYRRLFASWLVRCCSAEAASATYALAYVALWAIVMTEMRRRRIFIKI